MTDELAHYSFLSWMRQGLGNKIAEEDKLGDVVSGSGYADQRARLAVELHLKYRKIADGSTDEDIVTKTVHLVGPADIKGINSSAILRTEPNSHVTNFEANLLPYIEFYEEDFPWRYAPVSPQVTGEHSAKLRPWLTLIVLADGEYEIRDNGENLPSVSIDDSAVHQALGPQDETWAWAHVHLNQFVDGVDLANEVSDLLDEDPDIGISRIVCPRKLQKNTHYAAFLIPTFEAGRLGGLAQNTSGVKAQVPSWTKVNGLVTVEAAEGFNPNTFPYYYHWEFQTGQYGDFETLVSILSPFAADVDFGKLAMDIQSPGNGLDGAADSKMIGFEGALRPPEFSSDTFPDGPGDEAFQDQLKDLLNLSIDAAEGSAAQNVFYTAEFVEDPIITPPIYGYWHAMIKKLGNPTNSSWIESLNLDPRFRGMAGLGTASVQDKQEEYMEQAWQQVGEINTANQKIREAELSVAVNQSIYKKHLVNSDDDKFVQLTGAVHKRVLNANGDKTIRHDFKESRIPLAVNSSAFRRITRPEKKSIRQINRLPGIANSLHKQVISKFNDGTDQLTNPTITAAKLKQPGLNTVSSIDVADGVATAKDNYLLVDTYLVRDLLFQSIELADLETEAFDADSIKGKIDETTGEFKTIREDQGDRWASIKVQVEDAIDQIEEYENTAGQIEVKLATPAYNNIFKGVDADTGADIPSSKAYNNIVIFRELEPDEEPRIGRATTLADIETYENLLVNFTEPNTTFTSFISPQIRAPLPDLQGAFTNLRDRLEPQTTITAKVLTNIKVWQDGALVPLQELKPIMAYPEFEEPVYEALRTMSQDFILPNVAKLPANSLTILETNQAVVEAYLAGMNHETARELLWREFPTDQRGSYFRQFWDVRDNVFEEDSELKKDIKELHRWKKALGQHRVDEAGANLVLVVRGDLLLKYPNTIIYAQQASYDPDDPTLDRQLPDDITEENTLFPVFSAELEPDIFLFGFQLSVEEAKGERVYNPDIDTSNLNPGWFFVFRERPGQIKFGLDDYADELGDEDAMPEGDPATWNDLSWEHLVDAKADLASFVINFSKNVVITQPSDDDPNPEWGNNSADMASILYQNPVIFARHAAEMF